MKEELEKQMATLMQANKDQATRINTLEKAKMELRDEHKKTTERLTAYSQQLKVSDFIFEQWKIMSTFNNFSN